MWQEGGPAFHGLTGARAPGSRSLEAFNHSTRHGLQLHYPTHALSYRARVAQLFFFSRCQPLCAIFMGQSFSYPALLRVPRRRLARHTTVAAATTGGAIATAMLGCSCRPILADRYTNGTALVVGPFCTRIHTLKMYLHGATCSRCHPRPHTHSPSAMPAAWCSGELQLVRLSHPDHHREHGRCMPIL